MGSRFIQDPLSLWERVGVRGFTILSLSLLALSLAQPRGWIDGLAVVSNLEIQIRALDGTRLPYPAQLVTATNLVAHGPSEPVQMRHQRVVPAAVIHEQQIAVTPEPIGVDHPPRGNRQHRAS